MQFCSKKLFFWLKRKFARNKNCTHRRPERVKVQGGVCHLLEKVCKALLTVDSELRSFVLSLEFKVVSHYGIIVLYGIV